MEIRMKCVFESNLVTTVRQDCYPLLSQGHVLDVGEVLLVALLNGGQQQKAVPVWGEQGMGLRV